MSATTETRLRTPLPDSLELGEFTLLLPDETVESGAPLAAQIRAEIAAAFANLDPVLSLAYELEITEIEVGSGSRKSKNKVRLKRKKGKTLREKLMAAVAAASMALGFMSTDFAKLTDNLDTACKVVITDCNLRGIKAEIPEKHFFPVVPSPRSQDQGPPGSEST